MSYSNEYDQFIEIAYFYTQAANWSKPSSLPNAKGSFLGVAAVDIEAKSLGQYPLSSARGCYAITVDLKGNQFFILYVSQ